METQQSKSKKQGHLPDKTVDFFELGESAMSTVRRVLEAKVGFLLFSSLSLPKEDGWRMADVRSWFTITSSMPLGRSGLVTGQ